jgi:DNA-binding transcriptional LysR family regulator
MAVSWDDLRIFLAVARAGTLGAAARELGQTQPTMGRRIRALEDGLGLSLFQRTADGFVLTHEGAGVLSHAERMEEEATAFERGLTGPSEGVEGLLRISSSEWFGHQVLAPIFARLSQAHPALTLELITDTRMMSLARREADLVFRFRGFDEADVLQRKVLHLEYGLYAAETYLAARSALLDGDGAGHALITVDTAFDAFADVVWLRTRLPNAHIAQRSNSRDVQLRLCAAGAGVAVLPRLLGSHAPGLREVHFAEPPPGRDVWIGYHRDLRRLPRLRTLIEVVLASPPFIPPRAGPDGRP